MYKKPIEYLLDFFLKHSKSFRDYINNRYNREGWQPIEKDLLKNTIISYKGYQYYFTDRINSLKWCERDYDFSDITKYDIILDIGTEFGGLSIPISGRCKHVYCIEADPEMRELLRRNIELNGIKNITVLDCGLKGNEEICKFDTVLMSLSEVINILPEKPNFLKIDCEGAEWSITPGELKGFDRIEGEIHNLKGLGIHSGKGKRDFKSFLNMINDAGFDTKYTNYRDMIMLLHAVKDL